MVDRKTPVRKPSRHRVRLAVLAVLLPVLASVLVVEAYTSASFAPDHAGDATGGAGRVPRAIATGGPVIDATHGDARSYQLPSRTITLTFDDGPSREWTPQILDVLRRYHVHATFFDVGDQVSRYPEVARREVADGNEVGSHTFTHSELSRLPAWRRGLEYSQTQLAIAAATGMTTSLLREPYSSEPSSLTDADWSVVREAGGRGYLSVLVNTDSEDWQERDVDRIIRNATPADANHGAVVLMHDAGGDRSRVVRALERYIPLMLARGYRFTTVSAGLAETLGVTPAAVPGDTPASGHERWRGAALLWTIRIANGTFEVLWVFFLAVGALTVLRTLMLFGFARRHVRSRRGRDWAWGPPVDEPVTVLVPAYNEKEGIAAAVTCLAHGDYPEIEVLVIDDGSTDGTADIVAGLGLPNVGVVRKPNGGKAAALNTGIAAARHDLIVMVDGDTILEPDSIHRLVQPFGDNRVGAVAGNVKVGNRSSVVARWQHIEYVIGFNLDRRLQDVLGCMSTVPGAIGAFRRAALRDVGGLSDDTLAEDTDLTMALSRAGWRVVYEETARAWTEAPVTMSQLWKQRYRWSYGTMQAMWKHRRALRERGAFGRLGLPVLALFGVALPLFAPLFDIFTLYGLWAFDTTVTALVWLGMLAVQMVTALIAFRLDRESPRPLLVLPLQQFLYRQMMYLVIIQSMITAVTGARLRWHKLHRTGLGAPPAPTTPLDVR